jgi:O-acetyl-ADP-ribose deacetylase (regulator of RNase III)
MAFRLKMDRPSLGPVGSDSQIPGPRSKKASSRHIAGTDKVYAATWAAFLAIQAHNMSSAEKIEVVGFPAMSTGFGGMPFDEAARQMAAYRHYLEPPHRLDWDFVIERHKAICYDGSKQVVR